MTLQNKPCFLRCWNFRIFAVMTEKYTIATNIGKLYYFFCSLTRCFQNNQHCHGNENDCTCCCTSGRYPGHCSGCSLAMEAIEGSNESPWSPPFICLSVMIPYILYTGIMVLINATIHTVYVGLGKDIMAKWLRKFVKFQLILWIILAYYLILTM